MKGSFKAVNFSACKRPIDKKKKKKKKKKKHKNNINFTYK
jgi:hypothetical protein